jgi:hypothetical protein
VLAAYASLSPLWRVLVITALALALVAVPVPAAIVISRAVRRRSAGGPGTPAAAGRRGGRGLGCLALFIFPVLALITVFYVPNEVNAIAYLAGAGAADTFIPVTHSTTCSRGSCTTVTLGYLASNGASTAWPGDVPLSKPVPVRAPVWVAGDASIVKSRGNAVVRILGGLFFDIVLLIACALLSGDLPRRRPAATARPGTAGRLP